MAKFAPLALVPLYVVGERGVLDRMDGWRPRWVALRPVALAAAVLVITSVVLLVHPAIDPGLATFWERTGESQLDRESPFSVWGQVDGLGWLQALLLAGASVLAVVVALVPRRRDLAQATALAAAVLVASQLAVDHWFYLYVPWAVGLLFVALAPARAAAARG